MKIFPFPEVVFSTSSQLSGDIKVVGDGPQRRLVIGGLVQSVSCDYPEVEDKVWGKLLDFPWPVSKDPKVLVLGLGGGTAVHLISRRFSPALIQVAEIDGAVIDVARKFFDLDKVANLKVEKADAVDFVASSSPDLFDLIVVDIYLGSAFPTEASKEPFFRNLKKKLKTGGTVSINRIFYDHEEEVRENFKKILSNIFGGVEERVMPGKTSMKNYLYFVHREGANNPPMGQRS